MMTIAPGEGERLEAEGRRRFWRMIRNMALAGFPIGLVGGFLFAWQEDHGSVPDWAVVLLVLAGAAGLLISTVLFFRRVDELELQDNLWGSTVGFYFYATLFPAWWALWMLDVTREPHGLLIYAASLLAGFVGYGWRKWRNR